MITLPRIWILVCLVVNVLGKLGNSLVRNQMDAVDDKWPQGMVYYVLSKTLPQAVVAQVHRAQAEFHSKTCIKFEGRSTQKDYITIQMGPECWSPIGRVGGEQFLNISMSCSEKASIIHLLMHAIGFHDEHLRFDRDDYVAVQWDNILKDHLDEFLKMDMDLTDFEQYDFDSVMHFTAFMYAKDLNQPTLITKIDGVVLDKRVGFSWGDIKKIAGYYNHCVDSTTMTTTAVTVKPEDICEEPNGYYASPVNCKLFYQCENGTAILQRCPAGLYFNPDLSVCDWPDNVNCTSK